MSISQERGKLLAYKIVFTVGQSARGMEEEGRKGSQNFRINQEIILEVV